MSALLLSFLSVAGLGSSAAHAGVNDFQLTVSTSKTSLTTATEELTYTANFDVPPGTQTQDGAKLVLQLDRSVKRLNNDSVSAIANAKSVVWDQAENTLTVTFNPLASGSPTSVSINARPSGVADSSSPLLMTATMTGKTTGNVDLSQTATTAPVAMPAGVVTTPATPGSLAFQTNFMLNVYPGNTVGQNQTQTPIIVVGSGPTPQLTNAQLITRWNDPAPGTLPLPKSWIRSGFEPNANTIPEGCKTVVNDADTRHFSCGAQSTFWVNAVMNTIPSDAAVGTYSLRYTLEDNRDGTGLNNIVVTKGTLTVNVLPPAATVVGYNSSAGQTQVAPGGYFDWVQSPGASASAGAVKDFTVTLPIPAGAVPQSFQADLAATVKAVQFTQDPTPGAGSTWSPLSLAGGVKGKITQANPEQITGIRYVLNDFVNAFALGQSRTSLTLRVKDDVAPATVLPLQTQAITYDDPTIGATTMAATGSFNRSITVIADGGSPALAGGINARTSTGLGATVTNGTPISVQTWTGGNGITPVKQPYQFLIIPKGTDIDKPTASMFSPISGNFPHAFANSGASSVGMPEYSLTTNSIKLSDGSTLAYTVAPTGELGRSANGISALFNSYTVTPRTALNGAQPVVVGVGSLSQNTFDVSDKNQAGFNRADLSDDASFGAYSGIAAEIRQKLADLGITTTNALVAQQSFNVSPSTSVGVSTSVQGSEDATPKLSNAANNYSGEGKTLPGGTVKYSVDVSNTGADKYENFAFVDVLPYTNDTFTTNPASQRGSTYDVTLAGNIKVLINGTESSNVAIDVASTTTPGATDWTPFTGNTTGVKALRVRLTNGVTFVPGDVFTLKFDGTVPSSGASRTAGAVAKNTVAYSFTASGAPITSESPAVSVKTAAVTNNGVLAGQAFIDLDANGLQEAGEPGVNPSGTTVEVWKLDGSNTPVNTGTVLTPNTDGSIDGAFSALNLPGNTTYLLRPIVTNANITIPNSALETIGANKFLKFVDSSGSAALNGGNYTASTYDGKSKLLLDTSAGATMTLLDLRLPLVAKTPVSGTVVFTDKNSADVAAGSTGGILSGYTVKLMKGASQIGSTITTNAAGAFDFGAVANLVPGSYTLIVAKPSGSALSYSTKNSAAFTAASGEYDLGTVTPGTGATGASIYVTDAVAPVAAAPTLTAATTVGTDKVNPTGAGFSSSDSGSSVTAYAWEIRQGATVKASGTATAASPAMTMPALADGAYTLAVTASDVAKNVSPEASAVLVIDKTAPVLTSTSTAASFMKGSTVPTNDAAWIALYGVTAADAGVGVPANGITVDTSAVKPAAGTYTVKFKAKDAVNNASASYDVSYTVAYVGDPVITAVSNSVNFEMGSTRPASDADWRALFGGVSVAVGNGATAGPITVDTTAVNFDAPGSYSVVFTSTDNLGATGTKTVTLVVRDTIAPAVALTNPTVNFAEGDTKPSTDAEFVALFAPTAVEAGTGVASTTVNWSSVDFTRAGSYTVLFTMTDNAGNTTSPAVAGTYVVKFAGSPSVKLAKASVKHEVGNNAPSTNAEWIELFGATATAAPGASIDKLTADASLVTASALTTPGTYLVTFTATDNNGVKGSTTAQFIVEDTTKPVVTVKDTSVKHVMKAPATAYTPQDWAKLFGASASDTDSTGVDAATWSVTEGVDFNTAGSYDVTFTVNDKAGNVSDQVKATLVVQAPPTSENVTLRIAQNASANLDPLALAKTKGSLKALTNAQLGQPDKGGKLELSEDRVIYTPAKNFVGSETMAVTVEDDLGQTGVESYTVTVIAKPKLAKGTVFEYTVPQDGSFSIKNIPGIAGLVAGSPIEVTGFETPKGFSGKVSFDKANVTFTSDGSSFVGEEEFFFTIADELGQQLDVPVKLTVAAPTIVLDQLEGKAGKTEFTVSASGLVPGKTYSAEFHSTPVALGSLTAKADGSGSLRVTVPAGASAETHHVVLLNGEHRERARAAFTVLNEGGNSNTGGTDGGSGNTSALGNTGAETPLMLSALALLLVMFGAAILLLRRRSKRGGEA